MDDIYKNIEKYSPNKKQKILIVFYDVMVDMLSNKKLNPIVTELFIRERKLIISPVYITQSYFGVPKYIRLNLTHCFCFENSKQKRASRNCISLIIHQIFTFKTL